MTTTDDGGAARLATGGGDGAAGDDGAGGDTRLPGPVVLSPNERADLLELARIALAVAAGTIPDAALDEALLDDGLLGEASAEAVRTGERRAAAFATLTEDGELRGCMGSLDEARPVRESVVAAALSAATWDPRFRPVAPAELARIEVDVSVLGPLYPAPEPERLRLGVDGVVVEGWGRRALLLPEVATLHHLDRLALLETLCRKAGLPARAWQDPNVRILCFRTARFGGPAEPTSGGDAAAARAASRRARARAGSGR